MTTVAPYPLQWPAGRPRRAPAQRKSGKFVRKESNGRWLATKQLTVADALQRLQAELDRIGARYPVVSSNLETRLDGLPRSGQRDPSDPGVAVYFQLAGKPTCLPCDTYSSVAQNIAAIAAHIEATRAIERHGVATVAEMFAGFAALPPPEHREHWSIVLGVSKDATIPEIKAAHTRSARMNHPDNGGTNEQMARVNAARDQALKERGQ